MDIKKDEEIFPIVNERGEIIGQAPRSVCHSGSKLLHPVIHLHLFNSEGKLFLQKRSSTKDVQPNKWDSSVGGHIDIGEEPKSAALREAREEIGIVLSDIYFIDKYIIETDIERELTYCFFTVSELLPKVDMDEVIDGRFWAINEIKDNLGKNIFTPNFEQDFDRYLSGGVNGLKQFENESV